MEINLSPCESFLLKIPSVTTKSFVSLDVLDGYKVSAISAVASTTLKSAPSKVIVSGQDIPKGVWTTVDEISENNLIWTGTVIIQLYWDSNLIQARQKLLGTSPSVDAKIIQVSCTVEGEAQSVMGINFIEGTTNSEVKQVKYNNQFVWCKPYLLTLSDSTGVNTTVNRVQTSQPGVTTGTLLNGSRIYHRDVLNISRTLSDGYILEVAYSPTRTVTSDTTISTSALAIIDGPTIDGCNPGLTNCLFTVDPMEYNEQFPTYYIGIKEDGTDRVEFTPSSEGLYTILGLDSNTEYTYYIYVRCNGMSPSQIGRTTLTFTTMSSSSTT